MTANQQQKLLSTGSNDYKGVQIMCDFRVCSACDMMVIYVYIYLMLKLNMLIIRVTAKKKKLLS